MSEQIWPGQPSGPNEHINRNTEESADRASLVTELNEQQRIGTEQVDIWSDRRVTPPGSGDGVGGRVKVDNDW